MQHNKLPDRFFQIVVALNGIATLFALSIYAYGGLFSRYLADDYCQSARLAEAQNIFEAVIVGYNSWLNSYSILFMVQLIEWGAPWGIRLMAGATILFWVAGLTWVVSELGKTVRLRLVPGASLWIASLVIFLSLYQAPNLYQILYWRTSLIPYTMPLVFFTAIAAIFLSYARVPFDKTRAVWAGAACFALVFFASGLGETTAALQVGLLTLAVALVWLTRTRHRRNDLLFILILCLAGAVISMLIIAFSPGTITRLDSIMSRSPVYNPVELSAQVIAYTTVFVLDAIDVAPLPNLVSLVIPFGVLYFHSSRQRENLTHVRWSRALLVVLLILVCMFIAIGFSYAPSLFVRQFPVARVRFASHFVLTLSLVLAGGFLGAFAGRLQAPVHTTVARSLVVCLLGLMILYPLNASRNIYISTYEYRSFAVDWDVRDTFIRTFMSKGATDIVVVQLDTIGGVGEYKGNERHWINRCAARFYGLNTLRAP